MLMSDMKSVYMKPNVIQKALLDDEPMSPEPTPIDEQRDELLKLTPLPRGHMNIIRPPPAKQSEKKSRKTDITCLQQLQRQQEVDILLDEENSRYVSVQVNTLKDGPGPMTERPGLSQSNRKPQYALLDKINKGPGKDQYYDFTFDNE